MTIKVGVQGRVILGPFGTPGSVDVPLRYAVVREGPEPKVIATKFKRTGATIAAGQTHVQFVDIEEGLSFPLPSAADLSSYVVYVGFDRSATNGEETGKIREEAGGASAVSPTGLAGRRLRSSNAADRRQSFGRRP
jgi:hypothetical protein